MPLIYIIIIPILALIFSSLSRPKVIWRLNMFMHGLLLVLGIMLAYQVCKFNAPVCFAGSLRVDALSAFFILIIALVNFSSLAYSGYYFLDRGEDARFSLGQMRLYYMLFNILAFTMFFVPMLDNLGFMWVAIEMTTLASVFLVGFYNNKSSVEAAWKYVIICSAGITLALLGTVLFYYIASAHAQVKTLDWSVLASSADKLDYKLASIAFLFVFIGYGTKAGIVPMHTWLPDAYGQSPSPISALLSGVLSKLSLYAIIRFAILANRSLGGEFVSKILVFFGLLCIIVAGIFLIVQKDIKRLFAYSSIEHMGLVIFGLGVGSPVAIFGALFHMLNHALGKLLLFFAAGNIARKYKTHNMHLMHGVIQALPFTAIFLVFGVFTATGMPPFSIFLSKFMIISASFQKGLYLQSAILLVALMAAFGAFIFHLSKIIFSRKPKGMPREKECLSVKIVFSGLAICLIVLGIYMPKPLSILLESASKVITG